MLLLAVAIGSIGFDPLRITLICVALTVVIMPLVVLPFLVLMNDKSYLHDHTNRIAGNIVVMFISLLASVLAIISIPLQIVGSS